MNKDNLILSGAVFVLILLGFVAFLQGNFTGSLIKTEESQTKVIVLTKEIKAGDYVEAKIIPGPRGVEKTIEIFRGGDNHRKTSFYEYNAKSRYWDPITIDYKTYASWEPDVYYIVVHDIASGKTSRDSFEIIE